MKTKTIYANPRTTNETRFTLNGKPTAMVHLHFSSIYELSWAWMYGVRYICLWPYCLLRAERLVSVRMNVKNGLCPHDSHVRMFRSHLQFYDKSEKKKKKKRGKWLSITTGKRRKIETDNLLHGLHECVYCLKSYISQYARCTPANRIRWNTSIFGTNKSQKKYAA